MPTSGGTVQRNQLVEANVRLVYTVVRRYKAIGAQRRVPREDLEQQGFVALVLAAERFDAGRGLKFSTFAWACIERMLRRFLHIDGTTCNPLPRLGQDLDRRQALPDHHDDEFSDRVQVAELLCVLPSPLRQIIHLRYDLDQSFPAIGRDLGMSRDRVRMREQKALVMMREAAGVAV